MIKEHLKDKSPDYIEGFLWGIDLFSHWKDGVCYCGTCGTTRKDVFRCVNQLLKERKMERKLAENIETGE